MYTLITHINGYAMQLKTIKQVKAALIAATPNATIATVTKGNNQRNKTSYYTCYRGNIKRLDGPNTHNAVLYLGQHFVVYNRFNSLVGLYHTHRAALKAAKGAIVASGNGATVNHHYACGNELTITYGVFNGKLGRYNIA